MTFFRIIAITATLSSLTLGLLIIGTMYQIALSIRIMVGDVEVYKGKTFRNRFYAVLLSLIISLTIIIIFANLREGQGFFKIKYTMFVTFIIIFTLLSVIYTATICLLMKVMDKVNDEKEFRKEKISILL